MPRSGRVLRIHRRAGRPRDRLPGEDRPAREHHGPVCRRQRTSGEGTPNGSVNENNFFNGYPDDLAENMKLMDRLGGPDTYGHFPTGWRSRLTPFQMFKRYSQYSGARADPLVISWRRNQGARRNPRPVPPLGRHRADDPGGRWSRDAENIPGRRAIPAVGRFDEVHLRRRPACAYAEEAPVLQHARHRGIWEDGWLAATVHAPFTGTGHFDQDQWQLYHVDTDRSESTDLAKKYPRSWQR